MKKHATNGHPPSEDFPTDRSGDGARQSAPATETDLPSGNGNACAGHGRDDTNRGQRVRVGPGVAGRGTKPHGGNGNGGHGVRTPGLGRRGRTGKGADGHGANGDGANGDRPDRSPANGSGGGGNVLITGGAGFIGTNLTHRILSDGERVTVLDDLSRPGVRRNLEWLQRQHGSRVQVRVRDVRDPVAVTGEVRRASAVFHLAGQVAVTTSICAPRHDFEVNAQGTLNVLEALRRLDSPPPLLFTSTNKVYGDLADLELVREGQRWAPTEPAARAHGVSEERPLEFHSPYGCSKGTADQYVLDYARTYGLPATVFRMSCIYGPHQCGTEDQGWVAHFLISLLDGDAITLYGDGHQVRDVLYVDDLVEAMLAARGRIGEVSGRAFNIGGGPGNAVSLLELLERAGEIHGDEAQIGFADWRTGDQRYYVSDTRAFRQLTGWSPKVGVEDGVERLYGWLAENRPGTGSPLGTDGRQVPSRTDRLDRPTAGAAVPPRPDAGGDRGAARLSGEATR